MVFYSRLERVAVIHPGLKRHPLGDRVEAVPLASLARGGPLFQAI
jgi:hypothetical protein